ncbi:hypothetical protein FFLO_07014 [Filobasidium floriforme]|uniref:Uncharacterized protein n=1 Tax=Filobasidium floriforme TaxID=5210 RepID=A0A8K0NLK3_9TREE|nr:hypothetical protein FFLO_07014 [Filobasidium floriforme]
MFSSTILVTALAAMGAMAAPAAPPALTGSVSNAQCDQYTNGEGNAALCGPVFQTTFALTAQANNINSNVDGILKTVNEAIGANGNAVTEILQTGTLGLVSTLADGAGVSLYGLATTLNNLQPQCKCDLSSCYTSLESAASDQVESNIAQASCAQAQYACAPYYSKADVDKIVPGCAQFEGTTSSK